MACHGSHHPAIGTPVRVSAHATSETTSGCKTLLHWQPEDSCGPRDQVAGNQIGIRQSLPTNVPIGPPPRSRPSTGPRPGRSSGCFRSAAGIPLPLCNRLQQQDLSVKGCPLHGFDPVEPIVRRAFLPPDRGNLLPDLGLPAAHAAGCAGIRSRIPLGRAAGKSFGQPPGACSLNRSRLHRPCSGSREGPTAGRATRRESATRPRFWRPHPWTGRVGARTVPKP